MNRPFAFLLSLVLTGLCISSTSLAAELGALRFNLELRGDRPHLAIRNTEGSNQFGNSMQWRDLVGADPAVIARGASAPLRFAIVREAGRVECNGTSVGGAGTGSCSFTANADFANMLESRGIGRPDERQAFGLAMVGASRSLVEAIAAAHYPAPSINNLTALAALNVTPAYIADLASRGYRPEKISDLISFKALGVSPDYVDELRRAGFTKLTADQIVEFKALNVSPAYLFSLRREGYADLTARDVTQLRALGVTAEYIQAFRRAGHPKLSVQQLIQCKAMGIRPEELRALGAGKRVSMSADQLIDLKVAGLLP